MYKILKSAIKYFLPQRLLLRNEKLMRQLSYLFYKGNKYHCNTCEAKLSKFVELNSNDLLCPRCGSLPRTRRLWKLVAPLLGSNVKILHFSPSRVLYRKFKSLQTIEYLSTDFENEFLADQKLDIRQTGLSDDSFDIVICFHVLEHIDEDIKAMAELFRILKPGGQCFIQTPFKTGDIYENPAITSPEDRLQHFGQADHVRIYSEDGLKLRLEDVGFQVDLMVFEKDKLNPLGFKDRDVVLVSKKG